MHDYNIVISILKLTYPPSLIITVSRFEPLYYALTLLSDIIGYCYTLPPAAVISCSYYVLIYYLLFIMHVYKYLNTNIKIL